MGVGKEDLRVFQEDPLSNIHQQIRSQNPKRSGLAYFLAFQLSEL